MFERFRRDLARYFSLDSKDGDPGLLEKARIVFDAPQIQAIALYRFNKWVEQNIQSKPLRVPLKAAYLLMERSTHSKWGVHIHEKADIGGGLYIGHPHGVLIGPTKMGVDCNVSGNVTIGRRSDGTGDGIPKFGDRVWIGQGSVVFGGIEVGSGATIGPLTCVGRNVAPRSMVAGNPMQVLRRDYNNEGQIFGWQRATTAGPLEPRKVPEEPPRVPPVNGVEAPTEPPPQIT